MTRGRVLSDPKVIKQLNASFVPVELNLTQTKIPDDVAGLKFLRRWFATKYNGRSGFTTSVVLDPSGQMTLGTAGCAHLWELKTSISYDPLKYAVFLDDCRQIWQRIEAVKADRTRSGAGRTLALWKIRKEIERKMRENFRCKNRPAAQRKR